MDAVAVTGGNGRIGKAILSELNEHGYRTVNLARGKRREEVSDQYLRTDLTTPGEVYGSLAMAEVDAVIHMGTLPHPRSTPGYVTFESNAMSTYLILEAANALGIDRVCLASSINALGATFQDVPPEVAYLPVDEEHPLTPRDPYAIGKHVIEVIADGLGRTNAPPRHIASLRYPWVATDEELRSRFLSADRSADEALRSEPGGRKELFAYLRLTDAARAARNAIEADLDAHEVYWVVAPDSTADPETSDIVERFYPEAERLEELTGHRSLIDTSKAQAELGWSASTSWRDL